MNTNSIRLASSNTITMGVPVEDGSDPASQGNASGPASNDYDPEEFPILSAADRAVLDNLFDQSQSTSPVPDAINNPNPDGIDPDPDPSDVDNVANGNGEPPYGGIENLEVAARPDNPDLALFDMDNIGNGNGAPPIWGMQNLEGAAMPDHPNPAPLDVAPRPLSPLQWDADTRQRFEMWHEETIVEPALQKGAAQPDVQMEADYPPPPPVQRIAASSSARENTHPPPDPTRPAPSWWPEFQRFFRTTTRPHDPMPVCEWWYPEIPGWSSAIPAPPRRKRGRPRKNPHLPPPLPKKPRRDQGPPGPEPGQGGGIAV
ncbi:hypothetical protein BJ166DRAFT_610589 [Pestalotiopsis sp. NC0098]|nr:hypothetical protein BJ166DRAFT_610589 [Pestalotiopsis sp. NC0098]